MTPRFLPVLAVFGSVAALAAAGCGSSGNDKTTTVTVTTPAAATDTTSTTPASTTPVKSVKMVMTDFKFTPDNVTVAAGDVRITQTNAGGVEHEFVLLKTDAAPGSFPVVNGRMDEDKAGKLVDEMEVKPGKSKTKTFTVTPGKYVFVCNLAGHYAGGMYGALTVQ